MTIILVILILAGAYVGFMSEMDDNTKKIALSFTKFVYEGSWSKEN